MSAHPSLPPLPILLPPPPPPPLRPPPNPPPSPNFPPPRYPPPDGRLAAAEGRSWATTILAGTALITILIFISVVLCCVYKRWKRVTGGK